MRTIHKCPRCHQQNGQMYLEARFRVLQTGTLIFDDFSICHREYDSQKYHALVKSGIPAQVAHKRYKVTKRCHLGKNIKKFGGF